MLSQPASKDTTTVVEQVHYLQQYKGTTPKVLMFFKFLNFFRQNACWIRMLLLFLLFY